MEVVYFSRTLKNTLKYDFYIYLKYPSGVNENSQSHKKVVQKLVASSIFPHFFLKEVFQTENSKRRTVEVAERTEEI